jgi:hypothetical protein
MRQAAAAPSSARRTWKQLPRGRLSDANFFRKVLLHAYTHRTIVVRLQRRNIRQWRRRGNTHKHRQDHAASGDGGCAILERTDGQKAALAEDSGAFVIGIRELSKLAAEITGNAVMTRQLVVKERVFRRPQIQGTVVFMNLAFQEQPGFGFKSVAQIFIRALHPIELV